MIVEGAGIVSRSPEVFLHLAVRDLVRAVVRDGNVADAAMHRIRPIGVRDFDFCEFESNFCHFGDRTIPFRPPPFEVPITDELQPWLKWLASVDRGEQAGESD